MNRKYKLIILANEQYEDHINWIKACEVFKEKMEYRTVNLSKDNWYEEINKDEFDYLLAKPPGETSEFKKLYDERIHLLNQVLKYPVFPTYTEILLHENKRFLYSWLKVNHLPHPLTKIYYDKKDALEYLRSCTYPIISKTNIGASGSGVYILKTLSEAVNYLNNAFKKGVPRRWGPNYRKNNLVKRAFSFLKNYKNIHDKLNLYNKRREDLQKGYVILQEYIWHTYEWRIVFIGDSFFAHKKLKKGDKASGSLLKNYDNPPLQLLDFAKQIKDRYSFTSQAIDVFENGQGKLLINEMQCMFGQSDSFQMLVNSKPGRYIFKNNKWLFQEGMFNDNESYNLRMEAVLDLIESNQKQLKNDV